MSFDKFQKINGHIAIKLDNNKIKDHEIILKAGIKKYKNNLYLYYHHNYYSTGITKITYNLFSSLLGNSKIYIIIPPSLQKTLQTTKGKDCKDNNSFVAFLHAIKQDGDLTDVGIAKLSELLYPISTPSQPSATSNTPPTEERLDASVTNYPQEEYSHQPEAFDLQLNCNLNQSQQHILQTTITTKNKVGMCFNIWVLIAGIIIATIAAKFKDNMKSIGFILPIIIGLSLLFIGIIATAYSAKSIHDDRKQAQQFINQTPRL
ncbi:MAG: hypothetical protein OEY79_03405 [Anaplasmataceae bacterium]|nr:hypothetical protein [Anaplasmataceae bacterium]